MTERSGSRLRFAVRLTPRAGSNRVDGVVDGVLRCRVAAAPVEGAANEALLRLLGRELGLATSEIQLVAGGRGRRKIVALDPSARDRLMARWPGLVE